MVQTVYSSVCYLLYTPHTEAYPLEMIIESKISNKYDSFLKISMSKLVRVQKKFKISFDVKPSKSHLKIAGI